MEQVLFGGSYYTLRQNSITRNHLQGAYYWNEMPDDAQYERRGMISTDGKIKSLIMVLTGPPGLGKKYTFTLMLNRNPTAITFDIADDATTGSDMVNEVIVTGGDVVYLRCVPTGTPAEPYATWTSIFEGQTDNESLIMGGAGEYRLDQDDTEYAQVMGSTSSLSATENDFREVVPTAGTIKDLYVELRYDPGNSPDAFRFTLRKGPPGGPQVSQTLTVTITANDTTGSDLVNSVNVLPGDILTMMIEPLNTPAEPYCKATWGMTFVSDVDDESIVMGGSRQDLDDAATEYNIVTGRNWESWNVNEDQRHMLGSTCKPKKLHMLLSGAPGAGKKYDFTLRVAGADSNVVATVAEGNTTGNSGDLEDTMGLEHIALQVVPDNTPAVVDAYWGFVCDTSPIIPPPPPTPTPAEPHPFVRCPKCKEVFQLERAGPVGERGVKDSRRIRCLECGTVFRTKGETWREAHGQLR